jgi:protein-S-isoprenylcysteine O-methyltransferase Ste14
MRDRLLKQASREYGSKPRLALLAAAGVIFVIILPLAILRLGGRLDRGLGWSASVSAVRTPGGLHPPVNAIIGGLMILAGWPFALWSIYVQFTRGRGTPVPVMATQKLIIRPPYSYCRNPMALGTILAYLGLSIIAGSPGAALLVALGAGALLAYIKVAEEREMVARFGEAYLAYRRRVPFIIPRPRRNR